MTGFLLIFCGFFNKVTAYTPTQNTPKKRYSGKEVPFGCNP